MAQFIECCYEEGSLITGRIPIREIERFAPGGGSASVVAIGEDDRVYVVKFRENGQGSPHVIVNEFVAAYLARMLDLPCAAPFIIDVDDGAIKRRADLLRQHPSYATALPMAGPAFGSAIYESAQTVSGNGPLVSSATNRLDAAGIIVFDSWVRNSDRANEGNILIYPEMSDGGRFYIAMIDHGHICGGPGWSDTSLDTDRAVQLAGYLPDMVPVPLTRADFLSHLDRLEALGNDVMVGATECLPDEWQCPSAEREALHRYFSERRALVRPAIYAAYL